MDGWLWTFEREMLNEYIHDLVDRHLNGDPSRFSELWDLLPNFENKIGEEIKKQNSWVYLQKETFDGWYLIESSNGFELYYQERGLVDWGITKFSNRRKALTTLLQVATDYRSLGTN